MSSCALSISIVENLTYAQWSIRAIVLLSQVRDDVG